MSASFPPPPARRATGLADRAASVMASRGALLLLAVVLLLASLGELILHGDDVVNLVWAIMMAGPVAFVDRFPRVAASLAIVGVTIAVTVRDYRLLAAAVLGLLVVSAVAAYRLPLLWSFVFAAPLTVNAVSPFDGSDPDARSFLLLVLVAGALGFGDLWASTRRLSVERDAASEAADVEQRERMLLEERGRISRELHDVVAHHISAIAIQAETARLTTVGLSDDCARRFVAIGSSARAALDEMRRLLGVMRAPLDVAEQAPQPGLGQLAALVDQQRDHGSDVRLTVNGRVRPLPAAVELVAYRVVQEALTNAGRHAAGAAIDVTLTYAADELRVRVSDDGPGARSTTGGFGLIGMRERVDAVGGSLAVGNRDASGFEITATLPTQ